MLNYPMFRSESSWAPLSDLRREMDRQFNDAWTTGQSTHRALHADWQPACDVEEGDDHYLISLEMAGVPKDQIKLEVLENQIVISGERKSLTRSKQAGQSYSDRRYGKFQRSFGLPAGVDAGRVEANYQDGILRVFVPKAETAKPRQVKITNGTQAGFFGKFLGQSPKKDEEVVNSSEGSKPDRVA